MKNKKTATADVATQSLNTELTVVQEIKNPAESGETSTAKPKKRWITRQAGGTYFYSSGIVGKKNIFVTPEYLDLLVNAIKLTEVRKDIKNLAYVIMPNHFYWIFRLSEKQDDPVAIYKDVKKEVSLQILKNLSAEAKDGVKEFEMLDLYKKNDKVKRSPPRKILWSFRQEAKNDQKGERKYKIWDASAKLFLIKDEESLLRNIQFVNDAPTRDRWQLVENSNEFPYLYVAEEMQKKLKA
jgi:REP element-mobilizing transposase RayT